MPFYFEAVITDPRASHPVVSHLFATSAERTQWRHDTRIHNAALYYRNWHPLTLAEAVRYGTAVLHSSPPPAPEPAPVPVSTAGEPPTYTALEAEAALCAWEAMLEHRGSLGDLSTVWDVAGSVAMRHYALSIGRAAAALWATLPAPRKQALMPFDWGFVDSIVYGLDWSALMEPCGDAGIARLVHKSYALTVA